MATVGIIANPASGKDIRRLVAHGRFVPNEEKISILKRLLAGLDAVGIDRLMLHAERVAFPHPWTEEQVQINSPAPTEFEKLFPLFD